MAAGGQPSAQVYGAQLVTHYAVNDMYALPRLP